MPQQEYEKNDPQRRLTINPSQSLVGGHTVRHHHHEEEIVVPPQESERKSQRRIDRNHVTE